MTIQKFFRYIVRRRNRFLLLAILVTAGLTLRMASFAKYNAYMDDFTSAVAGDFFFTSNYLYAEKIDPYQINSFDGANYDLSLLIRNYENSLRYNKTGTDFFYTVDAKVYSDADCTAEDTTFEITINYGDTSDKNMVATSTDDEGKVSKYGYLPGMETYNTEHGEQKVLVSMARRGGGAVSDARYLKITAHSIPKQLLSKLVFRNGFTYDESHYSGVYYGTLEAVFNLNITSGGATITGTIEPGPDYAVRYRLECDNASSGSTQVKVFYNSEKLSPDISLGTPNYDSTEGKLYVQTSVTNGGVKDLYFYKSSLNTQIEANDFSFVRFTNAELEDDTKYSISIHPVSGGTASVRVGDTEIEEAMANTAVTLRLAPSSGYSANGAGVTYTAGEQTFVLSISSLGDNAYEFTMPNGPVSITPNFRPLVQIGALTNGTLTANPTTADAGTEIMLTAAPADGYMLSAAPVVRDADNNELTLTEQGENVYSFTMPATPVTVTAIFVTA